MPTLFPPCEKECCKVSSSAGLVLGATCVVRAWDGVCFGSSQCCIYISSRGATFRFQDIRGGGGGGGGELSWM